MVLGNKWVVLAVVLIIVVAAIGTFMIINQGDDDNDSVNSMTIMDDRGVNVTVPKHPQRIISMGSAYTEILFSIGAQDQIVGVDKSSTYPVEVSNKTNVGSYFSLNLEAVMMLEPDLVITWTHANSTIASLEGVNITVIAFDPQSISGVMRVISTLGNVTGNQDGASAVLEEMKGKIDHVSFLLNNLTEEQRPKVYMELLSSGGKAPGPGTITDDVITMAGGSNINTEGRYVKLSTEYVAEANPDYIILEVQNIKTDGQVENTTGWSTVEAVVKDQIVRIDGAWLTASPRIVLALEQFALWFHPELFAA